MENSNDAMGLKLDPISAQIIRQDMIHAIERINDEDLEEPAVEITDEDEITSSMSTTSS